MFISRKKEIPGDHPLCRFLKHLTASSFDMVGLRDQAVVAYVSEVLVDFAHVDNVYRLRDEAGRRMEASIGILMGAEGALDRNPREIRKHIGDCCLFFTGLYPDSLERERRLGGARFYMNQGKEAYHKVSEMDALLPSAALFRKLSDVFEDCVRGLHVEREFLTDPFYQYLLRQMGW
jgi:hypothetical protein